MKYLQFSIVLSCFWLFSCQSEAQPETDNSSLNLDIQKIIIDDQEETYGYYLTVQPTSKKIDGVLVLFAGFGQRPEDIFLDTKLPEFAAKNNLLTIGFAGRTRLTADSLVQEKLTRTLENVVKNNKVESNNFFLGGFSAGGNIALRYAELCKEFPDRYPINPRGVFMADSPIDLFYLWSMSKEILKTNYSEIAVNEAKWIRDFHRQTYGGTPDEQPAIFRELSPFSMDKALGENEQFLQNVAVRTYHDIDIPWRLVNRNQNALFGNYIPSSELINRLMLMGNEEAEFIQTFQTGYRRNGERHPHSWSIIDAEECVGWIKTLIEK
ncbi:MAG: hypothetical protein ACI920_003460 [Saprospiraceae bacterium]|jgi:hypothetical protein